MIMSTPQTQAELLARARELAGATIHRDGRTATIQSVSHSESWFMRDGEKAHAFSVGVRVLAVGSRREECLSIEELARWEIASVIA
jgi:hypothetical protein